MPVPYGGPQPHLGRRSVSHSHSPAPKKMDHTAFAGHNSHLAATPHGAAPTPHSLQTQTAQQAHALKLDEITRRVREQSDRFQQALMPVADQLKEFADSNPVLFTFLATFTFLSAVPILVFIGFVLLLSFCIISTAVFLACATITGVVLFGLAILLPILGATLAISGLLLLFFLSVFLGFRLLHHILENTQDAPAIDGILAGLRAWIDETKLRVGMQPSASHETQPALEGKPYLWDEGDTPRSFEFPKAAGIPNQLDDDVAVKTEKTEDSDWVSDVDADAEAPVQSTPRAPARTRDLAPNDEEPPKTSLGVPSPLQSKAEPRSSSPSPSPSKHQAESISQPHRLPETSSSET